MKKLNLLMLGLLVVALQNCTEHDEPVVAEKVQFTFRLPGLDASSGRSKADLDDVHALLLSLENLSGELILTHHQVNLLRFGDGMITEPLELKPGTYRIVDFLLVDSDENVLFATPKRGSPLAQAAIHPLPYSFHVSRDKITNVAMEVIDVTQKQPEDFGYASFHIGVVLTFSLSVFIRQDDQVNFTQAKGYILEGVDTIKHFNVDAKVTPVAFQGDPDAQYTLIISKTGYSSFSRMFNYNGLVAELNGKPLKVILEEAIFTMVTPNTEFQFTLGGGSNLFIQWGDGTSETTPGGELIHVYSSPAPHVITITGDIENITEFYSFYGQANLDSINFQPLINLKEVRFGWSLGPPIIDLTHNPKLNFLNLSGLSNLHELKLPEFHQIDYALFNGLKLLGTAGIDTVINSIHTNAIRNNTHNGYFNFFRESWGGGQEMIGPPSAEGMEKLRDLSDNYGWTIEPDVFD